uniref:Dystrophin n=1 Tax=Magallana gigas TaxID=29159 RepID=A0A8W8JHX3_MAGGI
MICAEVCIEQIQEALPLAQNFNDAYAQPRTNEAAGQEEELVQIIRSIADLRDWFEEKEKNLNSSLISTELDTLYKQLSDVKELNDEIIDQKGKSRDLITQGKTMMRKSSLDDDLRLREAVEDLKNKSDLVWKMGQEKQRTLEQAHRLAKNFWETKKDMSDWLGEAAKIVAGLEVMSIDVEQIREQQERIKGLKQEVQDRKPDVVRLNKAGDGLIKICGKQEICQIKQIINYYNSTIADIKNYLNDMSLTIDEALQESAEFTDKLEEMLDTLICIREMGENDWPISAHPDQIKDQLAEVRAFIEHVDSRQSALASIKSKADELINQAGDKEEIAVQDVKTKLSEFVVLYDNICQLSTARSKDLEDTLKVSEKFWEDYNKLCSTVKDLQDQITSQDPPALETAFIREQQENLGVTVIIVKLTH